MVFKHIIKQLAFFIIFLFLPVISISSQYDSIPLENRGSPLLKNYSYRDYQGHNQVWSIAQDKSGIMYFGNTYFGVLTYDGSRWVTIPTVNNSTARSLCADENGTIFVGSVGEIGFIKITNGEEKYISLKHNIPFEHQQFKDVYDTKINDHGVYFRSKKAVFRWHQNKMTVILPETQFVHRLQKVREKLYVVQEKIGLMELVEDRLIQVPDGDIFANATVTVMLPTQKDQMLLVSPDLGMFIFDGKSILPFGSDVNNFLTDNWVYCGAVTADGLFALGTYKGVVFLDSKGNLVNLLDKTSGLMDTDTLFVFKDYENDLWLGLDNGIARITLPGPFRLYGEESGIIGTVRDIAKHKDKMYVGTAMALFKEAPPTPENRKIFKMISTKNTDYKSLLSTRDGLMVSAYDTIFVIRETGREVLAENLPTITDMIKSRKHSDRVYASTEKGIIIFSHKNGQWKNKGFIKGLKTSVLMLIEDDKGDLWTGSEVTGIRHIHFTGDITKKPEIKVFDKKTGLPDGLIRVGLVKGKVRASTQKGLYAYSNNTGRFETDATFGLQFSDPSTILRDAPVEDPQGNVLIRHGLMQKVAIATPGSGGTWELNDKTFRPLEGYNFESDIYIENNDIYWLGSPEGLTRYDSKITFNNSAGFTAIIRRIINNGQIIFGQGVSKNKPDQASEASISHNSQIDYIIDYENNNLRFEYGAPSFEKEADIQYQVWLEGYFDKPSDWTGQSFIDYTNLPEGNYCFHVRAKNIYDTKSKLETFHFKILSPWFRTWWAYTLYLVTLILSFYCALQLQARRMKRKAFEEQEEQRRLTKQLEKQVDERTIELSESLLKVEEAKEEIMKSIRYAKMIQMSMLPSFNSFKAIVPDSFYIWLPRNIVGGDIIFADYINSGIVTALVDCTGHGIPGAFMAMIASSGLRKIVSDEGCSDPGEILKRLNSFVKKSLQQDSKSAESDDGMDVAICFFNKKEQTVTFAGAKQPIFYIDDGELKVINGDRQSIGYKKSNLDFNFTNHVIRLKDEMCFYLTSDGFIDQLGGEKNRMYGKKRLKKLLLEIFREPFDKQQKKLMSAFEKHRGNNERQDDITLMGSRLTRYNQTVILVADITFTDLPLDNKAQILEAYLKNITPDVINNNGLVKTVNDGSIMILFKNDPDAAVTVSMMMQERLRKFQASNMEEVNSITNIGFGIYTCTLSVSSFEELETIDEDVIANEVSISTQLSALNKTFGTSALICDTSFSKLTNIFNYNHRFVGKIIVKEERETISVFEIFDADQKDTIEKKQNNLENYDKGIFYYNSKNFEQAIVYFQMVLDSHPQDMVAAMYMERSQYFQQNESPPDWEFIEVLEY